MDMKNKINIALFSSIAFSLTILTGCSKDSNKDKEPQEPVNPIEDAFLNEVKPAISAKCFAGAYYRKVVSSKDLWLGIGGKVKLPLITFDPARVNPAKPQQYLDNPSVYLGGNANGQETDIGLTWEVIRDENGAVSADRRAFRPFMRRTAYSATGQTSNYANAPAEARYYWYQGEEVNISVEVVRDGWVKFIVEGEGKKFETEYQCDGYKNNSRMEFKRVNAIDQVANEGKPAQATGTRVENSIWYESYLFRKYNGQVVHAPLHPGRFTDMRCPDVKYFTIETSGTSVKKGGEAITIDGGK